MEILLFPEQVSLDLQPSHPQSHLPLEEFLSDLNIIDPARNTIAIVIVTSNI
jgi:hypothetical protein